MPESSDKYPALYMYEHYLVNNKFYTTTEFNFWFPDMAAVDVEKLNPHLNEQILEYLTRGPHPVTLEEWIRSTYF